MRIIISPAKKMNVDTDSLAPESLPVFLADTERLKAALQKLTAGELQTLWRCSDAIARENIERLEEMDLRRRLTPAVLAYEGIQYQYMAPGVFTEDQIAYIREHLRILSGFYGILGPFDGVVPYRLEMQARLAVDGCRDLYAFWGGKLADKLAGETDCVIDLASKEYSRAVKPWIPPSVRWITCIFGQLREGKVVEKGTMCKMARGRMVRWMAENRIDRPEAVRAFAELDYRFAEERSGENTYIFLKGDR